MLVSEASARALRGSEPGSPRQVEATGRDRQAAQPGQVRPACSPPS